MPRLMSFALTTEQIKNRTKCVTRRNGWDVLRPYDIVTACEKVMGRKKGEPLVRLCNIQILSVRRQPLQTLIDYPDYGFAEATDEGFPDWTGEQFARFYSASMNVPLSFAPRRIAFGYHGNRLS